MTRNTGTGMEHNTVTRTNPFGFGSYTVGSQAMPKPPSPPLPAPAVKAPVPPPQRPSAPNQAVTQQDSSPENRKVPKPDLGDSQRIATVGETVPIIFGKRVSNNGGVWVQPSLVRSGSYFFNGSFLFPVSQGELVSSPVKQRIWIGLQRLTSYSGTITVSAIYNSAATLAGSPSTCPVLGAGIYCGNDTYTYLEPILAANGTTTVTYYDNATTYTGYRFRPRGSGDLTNTGFTYTITKRIDTESGTDITTEWNNFYGLTGNELYLANGKFDALGNTIGGFGLDEVGDYIDNPDYGVGMLPPDTSLPPSVGPSGTTTIELTFDAIDNQLNPLLPATDTTIDGEQAEVVKSIYADPNSTPTADNSAFADITFLKIVGDIYATPESGSYPTTTKQVSVYYEQGVKVVLYSGGLVDGSYELGSSNQLVDLAMYMFTIYKRSDATLPDVSSPIRRLNMEDIATFCDNYSLHFNGIVSESLNIIQFLSATSPFFLLSFQSYGGQYVFEPLLPLNASQEIDTTALTPAATFTEADILPGSFSKSYVGADDKTDVVATVLYRKNDPTAIGSQLSVQVRYDGVSLDAPVVQFDMSDFCANRNHAIIYAKHYLARRRYSLHSIGFAAPLSTAGLIPTDVIKIQRQRITSTGDNRTETEWYQITTINHSTDGTTSIEAAQFPVDGSNIATISDEVLNGTFTIV